MTGLLEGRAAIVTGAGRGIGRAIAESLIAEGASVIVADNGASIGGDDGDPAVARETAAALGKKALAFADSVASPGAAKSLVELAIKNFGGIDIVVNNAGTNVRKPPEELALAEWHHVMDTNLTSAFLVSRAAYPHMKRQGGGKVINIGSMMSIFGVRFSPAYAASKGGIVQLTKVMATAWAGDNIQVNAVLPGWIDTELTQGARKQIATLHDSVLKRTPAGRWGVMADMSGVAVFLASPASDFVTGTAIPVDGGYSIQG